jgi:DNA/RNA endonuclease YhcR with UshA esterase domain
VLLLLVLAAARCAGPGSPAAAGIVPTAEARRMATGSAIVVEGVVTAAPGAVGAGFPVQDGAAGIFVLADDSARVREGDRVRVAGTLAEEHGLLGIRPAEVSPRGRGRLPAPETVPTGGVGEGTESRLLRVRGTVTGAVVDDRPYGWKVTVDDGSGPVLVFVTLASGVAVSWIRPGQRLRVVGIGGQYDDHHEILPRRPGDLAVEPPDTRPDR